MSTGQSAWPGRAFSALTSRPCGPAADGFPPGAADSDAVADRGPDPDPPSLSPAPFAQPARVPSPAAVAAPAAIARNRRLPASSPSAAGPAEYI